MTLSFVAVCVITTITITITVAVAVVVVVVVAVAVAVAVAGGSPHSRHTGVTLPPLLPLGSPHFPTISPLRCSQLSPTRAHRDNKESERMSRQASNTTHDSDAQHAVYQTGEKRE